MTATSETIEIRLDPENPAQFFACCGLFELAAMFGEGVEACFCYCSKQPREASFEIRNSSLGHAEIMQRLRLANLSVIEESGEAPVTLHFYNGKRFIIDWWLLPDRSGKSQIKLWAGRQQTLRDLVAPMIGNIEGSFGSDLLSICVPMKGRFGYDPRSSWNSLDVGYSPDAQNKKVNTYPNTEILASIGLQGFRPGGGVKRNAFVYTMWAIPLPIAVARATVCGAIPVLGQAFSFAVEKRSSAYSCFTFSHPTQGA